jgi:hypothetical protein
MDVRPHQFLAKVTDPVIKRPVQKAVEDDMDSVKAYL